MINKIFKNSGAEFPIKIGNKDEVHLYATRLVNGECQLLITYCGELYLAKGDSTYIEISGSGVDQSLDNLKLELAKLDKKIDLRFETLTTALEEAENGNLEKFSTLDADIKANTKKIDDLDIKLSASIDEIKDILTAGKQSIVNAINSRDNSLNADITHSFDELATLITRIDSIPGTPIEPGVPVPPPDEEPDAEVDAGFGVDHEINGVMPEVDPII